MILCKLIAKNFLKYEQLELRDLPNPGIIAISGSNESGKSTVGETICFALFGRTFLGDEKRIKELVRWGELAGNLTMEFEVRGERWTVYREIDSDGNHLAKLYRSGHESDATIGVSAVNTAIVELGGCDFSRFVDSFYLGQREKGEVIDRPETIKSLIGLDIVEEARKRLLRQADDCGRQILKHEEHVDSLRQEIETLGVTNAFLDDLEGQKRGLDGERTRLTEQKQGQEAFCEDIALAAARFSEIDAMLTDPPAVDLPMAHVSAKIDALSGCADRIDQIPTAVQALLETAKVEKHQAQLRRFRRAQDGWGRVREALSAYRKRLEFLLRPDAQAPGGQDWNEGDKFDRRLGIAQAEVAKATARRRPRVFFFFIFLLLAACGWLVWYSLVPGAEQSTQPFESIREFYYQLPDAVQRTDPAIWLGVASGLSLLAFILLVAASRAGARIKSAQAVGQEIRRERGRFEAEWEALASLDEGRLSAGAIVEQAEGFSGREVAQAIAELRNGEGLLLLRSEVCMSCIEAVREAGQALVNRLNASRLEKQNQVGVAVKSLDTLLEQMGKKEAQIQQVRAKLELRTRQENQIAELEAKIAGLAADRDRAQLGARLAEGTYYYVQKRFTPELRRFVARLLPVITDGKYQHNQINEDFSIKVFSGEKNNFLDVMEISGGTYRQLLLCIRLALAQALIDTSVRDKQFVFLDEPFAFFDDQRATRAAMALPHISERLTQFFVVAQQFADQIEFDLALRPDPAQVVLSSHPVGLPDPLGLVQGEAHTGI